MYCKIKDIFKEELFLCTCFTLLCLNFKVIYFIVWWTENHIHLQIKLKFDQILDFSKFSR